MGTKRGVSGLLIRGEDFADSADNPCNENELREYNIANKTTLALRDAPAIPKNAKELSKWAEIMGFKYHVVNGMASVLTQFPDET